MSESVVSRILSEPKKDSPILVPASSGPLSGIRIVSSGILIAQPFAAYMAALWGAEVIHVERPGGDTYRYSPPFIEKDGRKVNTWWAQERRNMFSIVIDLKKEMGKEVFLKLLRHADIWMESSMPGTYQKLGISDELVRKINPKIVIVHISGFGHFGDSNYLGLPAYDAIAAAFSGWMSINGFPDSPPYKPYPYTGDYLTALHALSAALAGYIHARNTGEGVSIDVAQFECIANVFGGLWIQAAVLNRVPVRQGNRDIYFQPYDIFETKDGRYVFIGALGYDVFRRLCDAIQLNFEEWRDTHYAPGMHSDKGREFDSILRSWVKQRTSDEVLDTLRKHNVPCFKVYTLEDALKDPHYRARNDFIEWVDESLGDKVRGWGIVPKFVMSSEPRVWRGSPRLGQDAELVLSKLLGYEEKDIIELLEKNVVCCR
ncbi:MAG: CaiB/BaiF CoA-transferase family protein [Sulfolobales archaeon]|nr:CoA transferase [Sulfolobales archaeon]MDW8083454.1 CaiB/BaiF CoA-transferase family protein [Sulfolobales archaeon]